MPRLIHTTVLLILGLVVHSVGWAQPPPRETRMPVSSLPTVAGWPEFTNSPPATPPVGDAARTARAFHSPQVSPQTAATQIEGELFELAETVAQVGDQYILKGELLGDANLILSSKFAELEKVPVEQREAFRRELLEYREQIMEKMLLEQAIERKLKYLDFVRSLPTESDPKKLEERRSKIQSQTSKLFADNLDDMFRKITSAKPEEYSEIYRQSPQLFRVALVMKEANIASREDPALEMVLRAHGTNLAKQQQAFMEYAVGQAEIRRKVNFQPEITHAQMVAYYREHEAEYQVPTRAKWEQMSVLFNRIPNEPAAWDAICAMGNEVRFGGAPFWAVAKRKSQEKSADRGGFHDWTAFGDLKISKPISDAVFAFPFNELSPIIKDDEGLHIVRVLDRQDAHQTPFMEVQAEIKEKLRGEFLNKAYADYVAKLRERTPVVTSFGNRTPASRMAKPHSIQNSVPR